MDGVSNWVTEIEVFLTSEEAAVGDLDTLQAQFSESQVIAYLLLFFKLFHLDNELVVPNKIIN